MRLEQVREILDMVVSYDRTPFPEPSTAVAAWYPVLNGIEFRDAEQAVIEHYSTLGARDSRGEVRRALPVDIKNRAVAIRDARERELNRARPKLPAGRVGSRDRPAEVEALLASARAKVAQAETENAAAVRAAMLRSAGALAA